MHSHFHYHHCLSSCTRSSLMNCKPPPPPHTHTPTHTHTHKDTPTVYKYKAKGRLLFRSLRVPSSSLPGAVFLQVVLCFPFQYSKFLNKPHTRTHTYSVQLQNQERHSVQEPQSTKQLSPGAVPLQVVLCCPFQYSKFFSKPHTRTHLQFTTTKPRAPLCSGTSEY